MEGAIVGVMSRPTAAQPYQWRVFVNRQSDLAQWTKALGPAKIMAVPPGVDLSRCALNHLYAWGKAPVLGLDEPPSPVLAGCRAGSPMWHPNVSHTGGKTHHISAADRLRSEFGGELDWPGQPPSPRW